MTDARAVDRLLGEPPCVREHLLLVLEREAAFPQYDLTVDEHGVDVGSVRREDERREWAVPDGGVRLARKQFELRRNAPHARGELGYGGEIFRDVVRTASLQEKVRVFRKRAQGGQR